MATSSPCGSMPEGKHTQANAPFTPQTPPAAISAKRSDSSPMLTSILSKMRHSRSAEKAVTQAGGTKPSSHIRSPVKATNAPPQSPPRRGMGAKLLASLGKGADKRPKVSTDGHGSGSGSGGKSSYNEKHALGMLKGGDKLITLEKMEVLMHSPRSGPRAANTGSNSPKNNSATSPFLKQQSVTPDSRSPAQSSRAQSQSQCTSPRQRHSARKKGSDDLFGRLTTPTKTSSTTKATKAGGAGGAASGQRKPNGQPHGAHGLAAMPGHKSSLHTVQYSLASFAEDISRGNKVVILGDFTFSMGFGNRLRYLQECMTTLAGDCLSRECAVAMGVWSTGVSWLTNSRTCTQNSHTSPNNGGREDANPSMQDGGMYMCSATEIAAGMRAMNALQPRGGTDMRVTIEETLGCYPDCHDICMICDGDTCPFYANAPQPEAKVSACILCSKG
jgi:hypothetical protein